jgi:acetyl esterase/lipase
MRFFSLLIVIMLWSVSAPVSAQHYRMHPDIPTDSSYNVQNELIKNRKKYPSISLVGVGDLNKLIIRNDLVYVRYGNRAMHLDLVRPEGMKKVPVVVILHAGGWRSGEKNMDRHIAYELSRNGFATVCVEYRLSMEARYPAGVQDIKTAIRWIRANAAKYNLQSNRLAIFGTSAGGQLAALIGSENGTVLSYKTIDYKQFSDKVEAVVDMDGVLAFLHPESAEGQDQPGKLSAATLWFGASSKEKPELFNEASAYCHVGKQTAPFLFVNSAQPRFHAGRDDMMKKLNAFGIYYEVHTIDNTPHTFWLFHPWFDEAMPYVVRFLNKTLNNK